VPQWFPKDKLLSRASAGMTDHQKEALREAARRLSEMEDRKVSMAEVVRRLLAVGGIR
jgi:hypothetical protein